MAKGCFRAIPLSASSLAPQFSRTPHLVAHDLRVLSLEFSKLQSNIDPGRLRGRTLSSLASLGRIGNVDFNQISSSPDTLAFHGILRARPESEPTKLHQAWWPIPNGHVYPEPLGREPSVLFGFPGLHWQCS